MTKLSDRIEAAEPGTDLTELAAEMLTFVTGRKHEHDRVNWALIDTTKFSMEDVGNPLTELDAIAALEREYGKLPLRIQISHNNLVAVMWEHGSRRDWTTAPTEPLARSAALVRALEVSRDV